MEMFSDRVVNEKKWWEMLQRPRVFGTPIMEYFLLYSSSFSPPLPQLSLLVILLLHLFSECWMKAVQDVQGRGRSEARLYPICVRRQCKNYGRVSLLRSSVWWCSDGRSEYYLWPWFRSSRCHVLYLQNVRPTTVPFPTYCITRQLHKSCTKPSQNI